LPPHVVSPFASRSGVNALCGPNGKLLILKELSDDATHDLWLEENTVGALTRLHQSFISSHPEAMDLEIRGEDFLAVNERESSKNVRFAAISG
jgi:hypothetical protein